MKQASDVGIGVGVRVRIGGGIGVADGLVSRLHRRLAGILIAAGLMIFDPFGWDGFGPIRWLVIPAVGFALVAVSLQQPWQLKPNAASRLSAESGLALGLLGWGVIASVFAVDPVHAWIGTPDRRFGWLTWLLCLGLFVASRRLTECGRANVMKGFAVGAVGLGLYTTVEWLGVAFGSGPLWPAIEVTFAGDRIGGPFGQPAHLGAAVVLTAPISAAVAADPQVSSRWRAAGAVGAGLCGLAILTSQSRAAWVGAVVAMTLFVTAKPRARKLATGPAVLTAIAVAAVPALRRRITGGFGDDGVIAGRIDEWRVGVRAVADAPLLGYGPEGYRTVFGAHVDPEYVVAWGRDVITDRAHSGVLDVALVFGVPGAVLYLALAALILRWAWRSVGPSGVQSGLAIGVTAYLVQQQFLFPLSEVDPLFWIAAGVLSTSALKTSGAQQVEKPPTRTLPVIQSLIGGLAIGVLIAITAAGSADVVANARLDQALDSEDVQPEAIRNISALRPDSIRYRFITSRVARQQGDLQQALEQIQEGLTISPDDPALRGEEARLMLDIARAKPIGQDRDAAITAARANLEALIVIEPNHPERLQRLGIARALDGDLDGAIVAMERAVVLAPERPEPRQNLEELLRLQDER